MGRHDARTYTRLWTLEPAGAGWPVTCEGHMEPCQGQATCLKPQSLGKVGEEADGMGGLSPQSWGLFTRPCYMSLERAVGEGPAEEINGHLRQEQ